MCSTSGTKCVIEFYPLTSFAAEPADPEIEDAVGMTNNPSYITVRQSSGSS